MDTIERSWMFITSGSYRVGVMLVHLSLIYSPETETPEIKKKTNKQNNKWTDTNKDIKTFTSKEAILWNCHPTSISQTNHKHPIAHLSDRWSTGPQLHQSCWKLWPCGTCVPVSCGSGSQSQLSEEKVSSELLHRTFLQNNVWLTYSMVWCLNWHLGRGASELNIWH